MSTYATEPTIFTTLSPDSLIRFKYSGGRTPGTARTVRFVSWKWVWPPVHQGTQGEGYLRAYDYNDSVCKTYLYSKMSMLYICSTPEQESLPESQVIQKTESKKDLLIKQMKAHIDSQNIMIQKFKERMFLLEVDCIHLEEDKRKAYTIMTIHKRRFPSTWETDFEPKELSGWEIINLPTTN